MSIKDTTQTESTAFPAGNLDAELEQLFEMTDLQVSDDAKTPLCTVVCTFEGHICE